MKNQSSSVSCSSQKKKSGIRIGKTLKRVVKMEVKSMREHQ